MKYGCRIRFIKTDTYLTKRGEQGEQSDAAVFRTLKEAIAKVAGLLGKDWDQHAEIESVPASDGKFRQGASSLRELMSKLGAKGGRGLSKKKAKHLKQIYGIRNKMRVFYGKVSNNECVPELFYIAATSRKRAEVMMGEIGFPGLYWTLYRHFKRRFNLPFAPKSEVTEGIWRNVKGQWKKVL